MQQPIAHPDKMHVSIGNKTLFLGIIFTLLAFIALILISYFGKVKVEVRDYIALITCGVVVTTLLYHAKNLNLNYIINTEKLTFDKAKYEDEKLEKTALSKFQKEVAAFKVAAEWYQPSMADNIEKARFFLNENEELLTKKPDIQQFVDKLNKDMDVRRAFISILNYFENIALLILKDHVCEEIIKASFKTVICDYFQVLRLYIEERQKESKRYMMNFEDLATRWSKL